MLICFAKTKIKALNDFSQISVLSRSFFLCDNIPRYQLSPTKYGAIFENIHTYIHNYYSHIKIVYIYLEKHVLHNQVVRISNKERVLMRNHVNVIQVR